MESRDSIRLLADSVSPLTAKFGDRLTLARERNCVQWSYEGNAAVVEFQPGDQLHATFIAAPVIDAVSSRPVSAVYRSRRLRYPLTAAGGDQMVADMIAFFSGEREPRFSFVNAYTP
jgi:hypothetical protein